MTFIARNHFGAFCLILRNSLSLFCSFNLFVGCHEIKLINNKKYDNSISPTRPLEDNIKKFIVQKCLVSMSYRGIPVNQLHSTLVSSYLSRQVELKLCVYECLRMIYNSSNMVHSLCKGSPLYCTQLGRKQK